MHGMKMFFRALQGYENALCSGHASTLDTVGNLGNLYADQGKLVGAEKMYQRALQEYQKALGPENILRYLPALNTAYNLGRLHSNQGERDKAKFMYSRALVGYEIVFGNDHEHCKDVRVRLSDLLLIQNGRHAARKDTGFSKSWD